jgi:hypothetical protein
MFKLGGNELTRRLGGMVAADSCLGVLLQLRQRNGHGGAVGLADTVVTANQCRQRHGFWGGKGSIPRGAVLYGFHRPAVGILVFNRFAVPDHLGLGLWMPSLRQPGKLLGSDLAGESEGRGKLPLPLSPYRITLFVIALRRSGVIELVIRLGLTCGEGFRHRHHG